MTISDPCALLKTLVERPAEESWLEFKESAWDHDRIAQYVAGLSNAAILAGQERGFLVFGVEDATHKIVGTTVALKSKKIGNENFQNWIQRVISPAIQVNLHDFQCDGRKCAIIEIAPSYAAPVAYKSEIWVRIGENLKKPKPDDPVTAALYRATSRVSFEQGAAAMGITAEQVAVRLDVDAFYTLSKTPKPQLLSAALTRLVSKGYLRDTLEGTFDITNLGALMLAHDLGSFETLASKRVRVVHYKGIDKARASPEQTIAKGYACGFEELLGRVREPLAEEKLINGIRTTVYPYHDDILRETIANALVHQDLSVNGAGPMVEVFSNRIEISNPGDSLVEKDMILNDRKSRNEKLANAMRELNLCEERGSGLDRTFKAAEDSLLPAPDFIMSGNSMRVIVFTAKPFKQLSRAEKMRALYFHCALRFEVQDYMSNASLRARFGLAKDDYQAVTDLITAAKKENRIKPADTGSARKGAKYIPYWAG
ncbi:MAG: putative DNA binding domain-containing protein [Hyphomonadaceae bacterium]|nr:putative DNA binding domain-containing protein [Hyphomonadaceae bacterium]